MDHRLPQGFRSPAGADLPIGFDRLIEAISIFAFTEAQEMTGQPGTNEIADAAVHSPFVGVWDAVVARIKAIPEYHELFFKAFPELGRDPDRITIVHVGKAIGAFQAAAFRSDNSPFDRFLRGDRSALSGAAEAGRRLFYGSARCARLPPRNLPDRSSVSRDRRPPDRARLRRGRATTAGKTSAARA